jgi:hypothetical protein
VGRARSAVLAAAVAITCFLALAGQARAYTFPDSIARATGAEQTVFDWTTESCEQWDIPDMAPRAFRDDRGRVQMIAGHYVIRRSIGPDLNSVQHECTVLADSGYNPDPSMFDDREWLYSTYTVDGRRIYGLVHQEYREWAHGNLCPFPNWPERGAKCWFNSITSMSSVNSGDTWSHAAPPSHLVAALPDRWVSGTGPYGMYSPSNIIYRPSDGHFYALVRFQLPNDGDEGTCLMRTRKLGVPSSWRAWDGDSFTVRFINPYVESGVSREAHLCKRILSGDIHVLSKSLTYNTYLGKYMLMDSYGPLNASGIREPGVYYSLSDDLIHWSHRKRLMSAEVTSTYGCGDQAPIRDPAVLDPSSTSRNFETVGKTAYLYFTRFNIVDSGTSCPMTADRDLIRIPIEFSGTPPNASLAASPNPAAIGERVEFDASSSTDPDGSIVKYELDMNDDGFFEVDNGSNPALPRYFWNVRNGKIGLRVTDDQGLTDQVYVRFTVNGLINFQPDAQPTAPDYEKDFGAPYSDARGYGWVRQDSLSQASHVPIDMSPNAKDRDPADTDQYAQRHDTFIFMQYPSSGAATNMVKTPAAWEMAVPCGTYDVTVSVGDSHYSSSNTQAWNVSTHRINVEGANAIAGFQPTDANKFSIVTKTTHVCDGKLTVDAIGGTNTKINYVEVRRASSKVNFQPSASAVPDGYVRDSGGAYSDARGFGWVREDSLEGPEHVPLGMGPNAKERYTSFDQKLDTLIFMQYPPSGAGSYVKTPAAWEMAVPCGVYIVTVSVGDAAYSSSSTQAWNLSTHRINIEGANVIGGFQPTDSGKFRTATRTVSVCDGRLTIDAVGGSNTKIDYVEAVRTG